MSDTADIDLLVLGLGPAGAAAAEVAARAGLRVQALDRRATPGLPVQCAELVPKMLGADLAAVRAAHIQTIGEMETYLGDAPPLLTPDFQGHMIDRARFDQALVEAAQMAGARCHFGALVRSVDADGAVHLADGTVVRAPIVIGADGPRSTLGAALGMVNRELVETRQISVRLRRPHSATDIFLRPEIIGGYGWLFPRGGEANLGLGLLPKAKARLKPLLDELHRALVAEGRVGANILRTTGGAIPVGGIVGTSGWLGATRALLAGDAAGLANPVTGAGINAAVLSGRMAGAAAVAMATGVAGAAEDYAEEINDLFGPSLALASRRRRELIRACEGGLMPSGASLQRAWIAYPEYWDRHETITTRPVSGDRETSARRTA